MKKLLTAGLAVLLITGCQGSHRTNFQQGNIIESKAVAGIRVGMTKTQVAKRMGSPVHDNLFRKNRWVYIHHVRKGGQAHSQHMHLNFRNGRLVSIKRGKTA